MRSIGDMKQYIVLIVSHSELVQPHVLQHVSTFFIDISMEMIHEI
jgi:hypothetical protein